jgi:hypothetical protein
MDKAKWEVPKIVVMAIGTVIMTLLIILFVELN